MASRSLEKLPVFWTDNTYLGSHVDIFHYGIIIPITMYNLGLLYEFLCCFTFTHNKKHQLASYVGKNLANGAVNCWCYFLRNIIGIYTKSLIKFRIMLHETGISKRIRQLICICSQW